MSPPSGWCKLCLGNGWIAFFRRADGRGEIGICERCKGSRREVSLPTLPEGGYDEG